MPRRTHAGACRDLATQAAFGMLAALTVSFLPVGARAQGPAYVVKDIETTPRSSSPHAFANVGGTLFFAAQGAAREDLWRSDGTTAGTRLVSGGFAPVIYRITDVNGTLFFFQGDSSFSQTLWTSDGVGSGAEAVKSFRSAPAAESVVVNGILFFSTFGGGGSIGFGGVDDVARPSVVPAVREASVAPADVGEHRAEWASHPPGALWRSDGTENGTITLREVRAWGLTELNGTLFFAGFDSAIGNGLWRSDGTPEGTERVKAVNVAVDLFYSSRLTKVNGALFFFAYADEAFGLWRSDGTEEGTLKIKDLSISGTPPHSVNANGLLFFSLDGALWRSDGTEAGTVEVLDFGLEPGQGSSFSLTNANGTLFFFIPSPSSSLSLWRSDGTTEGTVQVAELPSSFVFEVEPANDGEATVLFELANDTTGLVDLWRSDGTDAGTQRIEGLALPDPPPVSVGELLSVNGNWFFSAFDAGTGFELWRSDGTQAGTMLVEDLNAPATEDSLPFQLTDVDGTLFFTASQKPDRYGLWRSDGTEAGTLLVTIPSGIDYPYGPLDLTSANGMLFFTRNGRSALWTSDGTPDGTTMLKELASGEVFPVIGVDTALFFSVCCTGDEMTDGLWRSDGTTAGTVRVNRTSALSPYDLRGALFFESFDNERGGELWKSDGTEAGTMLVKDINPGPASGLIGLFPADVDGTLMFYADDGVSGFELWKSDGTEAGTVQVKDIVPGLGSPFIVESTKIFVFPELTAVGSTLFFVAESDGAGTGAGGPRPTRAPVDLWKSDGSDEGTELVAPFAERLYELTSVSGTLFFVAGEQRELWKSDGTASGTQLVDEFPDGLSGLIDVDGTLVFHSGGALWRSDGTHRGTARVQDLLGFTPPLVASGSRLFFPALDTVAGTELWAVPQSALSDPLLCIGDCNEGLRVTVNELVTIVNIALGNDVVGTCGAGDADRDGSITVDEIVTAVSHALGGCPA